MKSLGKYLAILFIFVLVFSAFPAQRASADAGVVDNPNGGFVTGGGWLNAADVQNGPINITGDTASIAYGGYTGYLYRDLDAVCDPNNTPVTFTGSLDVSGLKDNGADLFGRILPTGVYIYRLQADNNVILTKRIIL